MGIGLKIAVLLKIGGMPQVTRGARNYVRPNARVRQHVGLEKFEGLLTAGASKSLLCGTHTCNRPIGT